MPHLRLILGRGFIGRAVAAALPETGVRLVPHRAVDDADLLEGVGAVLHAGRHPALGTPAWRLEEEVELRLARRAAHADLPFLTLGTRKVYAPSSGPLREDAATSPVDLYGRQKLALEGAVQAILGGRLTRLRLGNIFGFEPGRPSFMGRMLDGLAARGEVRFDMSPFTHRDFLPVELAGQVIGRLLERPPGGIVNVGSGIALPAGRLALWMIEAYGRGRLVVDDPVERDTFVLDTGRSALLTGLTCALGHVRDAAAAAGRRLACASR